MEKSRVISSFFFLLHFQLFSCDTSIPRLEQRPGVGKDQTCFLCFVFMIKGFPVGTVVKSPPANTRDARDSVSVSWVRRIPWRIKGHPTPVFLPGKFPGQRSLAGCCPWGRKESDPTKHVHTHISHHLTHLFWEPGTTCFILPFHIFSVHVPDTSRCRWLHNKIHTNE